MSKVKKYLMLLSIALLFAIHFGCGYIKDQQMMAQRQAADVVTDDGLRIISPEEMAEKTAQEPSGYPGSVFDVLDEYGPGAEREPDEQKPDEQGKSALDILFSVPQPAAQEVWYAQGEYAEKLILEFSAKMAQSSSVRLLIPAGQVNVGLMVFDDSDGSLTSAEAQAAVDLEDMAAYQFADWYSGATIGDHNTQEFACLHEVMPGDIAYIVMPDVTVELICLSVEYGFADENNHVYHADGQYAECDDSVMMFTCTDEEGGRFICYWAPILEYAQMAA